jgi:hypothetical protein
MRYPTTAARKSLAARFGLPYADVMQDWEWEVADCKRFDEFLEAYRTQTLTDDERFSLMEILVQCAEDTVSRSDENTSWSAIEPLLLLNSSLHKATIEYWARLYSVKSGEFFRVSAKMRRVWQIKFS